MKQIKYQILGFMGVWNPETEQVEQQECLASCTVECRTEAEYNAMLPKIQATAYKGEWAEDGEFEAEELTDAERLDALEAAVLEMILGGATDD